MRRCVICSWHTIDKSENMRITLMWETVTLIFTACWRNCELSSTRWRSQTRNLPIMQQVSPVTQLRPSELSVRPSRHRQTALEAPVFTQMSPQFSASQFPKNNTYKSSSEDYFVIRDYCFFKNWSLFLSSFKLSPYWNYAFFKWKWNRGLPFAAVKAVQSRAHHPCNPSKLHTFKKDRNRAIKFNFELNLLSWLQRKVRLLWNFQPGQTDRRTDGLTDSWWYVHGQYTELPTCSIRLSCRIIHCYSGRCLSRHVYCQIFEIIQMNNESLVIGLFSHECQVLQN